MTAFVVFKGFPAAITATSGYIKIAENGGGTPVSPEAFVETFDLGRTMYISR